MSARKKIRETDADKSTVNRRTEEADFRKSENKAFRETENCIIKMTEKIEKQNIDELIKNKFFIKKTETINKKKLIIFLENASFFSMLFFSESRDSEKVKRTAII